MSSENKPSSRVCSIADAMDILGDRYALLVVRELRYGKHRFNEIAAGTGAPRDVLTARLRKLEDAGILDRRPYSERPPRYEHLLTEAGRELRAVLVSLREWGDRYCNPGSPPVVFQHTCGEEFHALTICAACRQPIGDGELTVVGGTHPVEATI